MVEARKPRPRRGGDGVPVAHWRRAKVETHQLIKRNTINIDLAERAALALELPRPLLLLLARRDGLAHSRSLSTARRALRVA